MDLTSVKTIKELLLRHKARPSKGLGQNFLIHAPTLSKIIRAADVTSKDTVLEIGPGLGTLTQVLARHAKKVVAIEKDGAMVEILKETLQKCGNVEVICGDILKDFKFNNFKLISNFKFQISNYKVVANIPYYITSPIIRKFLESKNQPESMVLMVQKEVAQRICAKPPHMSILAVSVQFYATAEIISYVSKGCFWPAPNVDSAIIKIVPFKRLGKISPEKFFRVVKAGFLHPRKQLAGNLSGALKKSRKETEAWLQKNGISPSARAETLTIEDWINLVKSY